MPEDHRTQNIAIALIVLAAVAIGCGEWRNWIHLIDFANMFGGGGVGILTGQKLTQLNTTKTGTINAPQSPDPKEQL